FCLPRLRCPVLCTLLCFFFFYCYGAHRDLHSFPTRRSSDLPSISGCCPNRRSSLAMCTRASSARRCGPAIRCRACSNRGNYRGRSEEHTSELQSRENLVCRLLLEKKKKKKTK